MRIHIQDVLPHDLRRNVHPQGPRRALDRWEVKVSCRRLRFWEEVACVVWSLEFLGKLKVSPTVKGLRRFVRREIRHARQEHLNFVSANTNACTYI